MTDALQRKMDIQSRNGTFEVDPNHSAYGARYCELCGATVNRNGECAAEQCNDETALAIKAIEAMSRWAIFEPQLLLVLSHKLQDPTLSVRQIAKSCNIGKSMADDFLHKVAGIFPVLTPALGLSSPTARSQRTRRQNERTVSV